MLHTFLTLMFYLLSPLAQAFGPPTTIGHLSVTVGEDDVSIDFQYPEMLNDILLKGDDRLFLNQFDIQGPHRNCVWQGAHRVQGLGVARLIAHSKCAETLSEIQLELPFLQQVQKPFAVSGTVQFSDAQYNMVLSPDSYQVHVYRSRSRYFFMRSLAPFIQVASQSRIPIGLGLFLILLSYGMTVCGRETALKDLAGLLGYCFLGATALYLLKGVPIRQDLSAVAAGGVVLFSSLYSLGFALKRNTEGLRLLHVLALSLFIHALGTTIVVPEFSFPLQVCVWITVCLVLSLFAVLLVFILRTRVRGYQNLRSLTGTANLIGLSLLAVFYILETYRS